MLESNIKGMRGSLTNCIHPLLNIKLSQKQGNLFWGERWAATLGPRTAFFCCLDKIDEYF